MFSDQQIVDIFNSGDKTIQHVVKQTNISWNKVKKILQSKGVNYSNPRIKLTKHDIPKIKQLIESGNSYVKIANILKVKYITLNKFCQKNNIQVKHGNSLNKSNYISIIKQLAQENKTSYFIGKQLKISKETIQKWCKEEDITLKDGTAIPLKLDFIQQNLKDYDYTFIDIERQYNKTSITAKHNKCGCIRKAYFWDFFKYQCPRCLNNGKSRGELEVLGWVQQYYTEAKSIKLDNKEIDIYIPSLRLGIEYCGLYWHSEVYKDRYYHHNKLKLANEQGIRLITIFEDEWVNRQSQVKNFLKSVINKNSNNIYARKCNIQHITTNESRIFLDLNHIQGYTTSNLCIGLFYDKELVGVMTGNRHHRIKGKYTLNRLAFKDNYNIVGGTSKLLSFFKKEVVLLGYKSIISWSDNRWSEGNVYVKCGFKLDGELKPDYSYYNQKCCQRINKQSCIKKNLIQKGGIGNTERELAKSLNYLRVYDCGKKRWVLDI